ncbi:MAG: chloride channel protein, partial [Betaproteobacteria bacterium]|nr:chloride channel protein [Betaproteobacteria bacterium]
MSWVARARERSQHVRVRFGATPLGRAADTLTLWLWAALTGVTAAAATVGFRELIRGIEWLATHSSSGLVQAARSLPPWQRVAVCTVGGLLAGLALHWGERWARRGPRGTHHIDYIEAARDGSVALNDRTTLVRSASALLSVGTGASIGREGPMVQLSAWLSTVLARVSPLPADQRNALLVCGIAAGIGSAYHAPVAGVVFVLELALGFFARHTVAPVLIAASTSSALIYWLFESQPLYVMTPVMHAPSNLLVPLATGLVCGGVGWGLLAVLDASKRLFAHVPPLPLRLTLGGVLVGLISAGVPEVWGNGYSVVSHLLQGGSAWQWVALILAAKVAATALSAGSGAIGGVFTPTLFVGA